MKTISALWKTAKNKLSGASPWVWLYEIEVPTTPTATILRYAEYTEPVVWQGNTFQPFPISHSEINESSEGRINAVTVTVSNVMREIQAYLEEWDYLSGAPVRIICVNLSDSSYSQMRDLAVSSTQYNDKAVTFTLSLNFDIVGKKIGRTAYRDKCAWVYKSAECAYSGAIALCDKTLGGQNGCRVHANAVRFGGMPGIPQGQVIIQ